MENEEKGRKPVLQKRKYRVRNEQIQGLKTSLALGMELEAYWKAISHLCNCILKLITFEDFVNFRNNSIKICKCNFFRTCATQIHFRTCATQIHFRTCATQIHFRTCATQIYFRTCE